MKRLYSGFRISLLTLTLGLASANFVNWLTVYRSEISVNLSQVESSSVFVIITKRKWSGFEFFGHGDILKYDGGKSLNIINAPTLELALEFERWQKTRKC